MVGIGPKRTGTAALFQADAIGVLDAWRGDAPGLQNIDRPRLIYLDPPFATGDTFTTAIPVGPRRQGQPTIPLVAYRDVWPGGLAEYLTAMTSLLVRAHDLLPDDGWLCVHVDYRASAHLRLLLDEIFGADGLRNEIVWSYGLGNARARDRFPRKHDTLLLYAKTPSARFHPVRGEITDAMSRKYRHVRPDGTRFMRSYGREYDLKGGRPVGSVWADIPSLSPTGGERNGYPTQKPLALLARLVAATTLPGDTILDPCCGSGTTALAAALAGRFGVGVDRSAHAIARARARIAMAGVPLTVHADDISHPSSTSPGTGIPPRTYQPSVRFRQEADRLHVTLADLEILAGPTTGPTCGENARYVIDGSTLVDRRDPIGRSLTTNWPDWLDGWAVIDGPEPEQIGAGTFRHGRRRDLTLDLAIPALPDAAPETLTVRLYDLFGATSDHVVHLEQR